MAKAGIRMKKINVVVGTFVIWLSFLINNAPCFAACDCNAAIPTWYLSGTKCPKYPYYYEVEITASDNGYDAQYPPAWSGSGSCHEYWKCVNYVPDACPRLNSCKESTYSDPNNETNIPCGLFNNGACYGMRWYEFWNWDCNDGSRTGHWNDKTFTGSESYGWADQGDYYNYSSTTSIYAEFDPNVVPQGCKTEPNVIISDYQPTMFVRPKEGFCCKPSGEQTITLNCPGASHIKATMTLSGDSGLVIMNDSKWEKGCYIKQDGTGAHAGSGSIKITPNHDKVVLIDGKPKTQTVTYTVEFYDFAGNLINTRPISVTLTTECPKEPK